MGYIDIQYIETDLYQSNWCLTKEGNWKVVLKLRNVLLNGKPPTWHLPTRPIRLLIFQWYWLVVRLIPKTNTPFDFLPNLSALEDASAIEAPWHLRGSTTSFPFLFAKTLVGLVSAWCDACEVGICYSNLSSLEKQMYLYMSELSSWKWIFWICITTRFIRYDLLVTVQIVLLDYKIIMPRYLPLFVTAHTDMAAL